MLEIGIGGSKDDPCSGGASLRMWRQYFRKSMIYGVDIVNKRCLEEKRIKVFQGDQNDPEFLQRIAAQIGKIDIIIDDGSHISAHIITSFITLFPYLDDAGIYAIEDLATAYWPLYGGNWQNLDAPGTSMSMLKGLADGLNYKVIPHRVIQAFDQQIVALHFYPKIAFVIKGHNDYPLSAIDHKMLGGEQ